MTVFGSEVQTAGAVFMVKQMRLYVQRLRFILTIFGAI